jgi:hypothetical protein
MRLKVRSDAKLEWLPREQREQVDQWLFNEGAGMTEVAARCKSQFGVEVSASSVARYTRSRRVRVEWAAGLLTTGDSDLEAEHEHEELMKRIRAQALALSSKKNIKDTDRRWTSDYAKVLIADRRARNEMKKMDMAREKFEFDAATACRSRQVEMKEIDEDESIDENERVCRVREELFGENLPE